MEKRERPAPAPAPEPEPAGQLVTTHHERPLQPIVARRGRCDVCNGKVAAGEQIMGTADHGFYMCAHCVLLEGGDGPQEAQAIMAEPVVDPEQPGAGRAQAARAADPREPGCRHKKMALPLMGGAAVFLIVLFNSCFFDSGDCEWPPLPAAVSLRAVW